MSDNRRFVAELLETSAVGYAGLAASLLLERHPEIAKRFEPDGFSSWKTQFQHWMLDLSAAVEAGESALFEARILWTREAFLARQAPVEDLGTALVALRDLLPERLPAGSAEQAVTVVDRAIEALADPGTGAAGDAERAEPVGRPALSYLETVLDGRPREAIEQVLAAVNGAGSVKDAYLEVLLPAEREIGRMWHAGELSIAEEHLVTATTERLMSLLCVRGRPSSSNDRTVLLACVAGNVHDLGIRAISDFFEMAGWRAINLGPDVPGDEIARSVEVFAADVVVLAATLVPHLRAVQRAIERIRALADRKVQVIVGGAAFESVPDLWRRVGADGHAARIEDAEPLGARLTP